HNCHMFRIPVQITVHIELPSEKFADVMCILIDRRGNLSRSEAAALTGQSDSGFSHEFRKQLGLPFREARLRVRLHIAAQLLCDTTMRISEVARTVGYDSLQKFEQSFRKRYQKTPTDYRESKFASQGLVFCISRSNTSAQKLDIVAPRLG